MTVEEVPESTEAQPQADVPRSIDRRSRLERAMDALHAAMDLVDGDAEGLDALKRTNIRDALKYAHDHIVVHQHEKSRAESLALGVFGTALSTASGIALGYMLTKPNEPRAGWARDALRGLSPEHKAAGLTALKQLMAMVGQWVSAQETPEAPNVAGNMRTCGAPGPADTVEGSMWEPCPNPVEFVVEHPKFGNRGHVQRVCCAKHRDYLVGGAADARVMRIDPPPPAAPPPTEH